MEVPGRSRWWIDKLQDHDRNRLPLKHSFGSTLDLVFDRYKVVQHLNLNHQSDFQYNFAEIPFSSLFASIIEKTYLSHRLLLSCKLSENPFLSLQHYFWISELATLFLNSQFEVLHLDILSQQTRDCLQWIKVVNFVTAQYAVQVDVSNPNLSEATGPKISSAQHAMSTLTPEWTRF